MNRKKKTSFREKDVSGPPDEPWLPFGYTFFKSPAWLSRSEHLRKLLDFLHIEHLRHDRQRNGNLLAPYGTPRPNFARVGLAVGSRRRPVGDLWH